MLNKIIVIFTVFIAACAYAYAAEPSSDSPSIYLTWQRDPTTTMTIQWISTPDDTSSQVDYKTKSDSHWETASGTTTPLPYGFKGLIHRIELTNLLPETDYLFRLPGNEKEYKFQTMPSYLDRPIRFVEGGDIYHDDIKYVKEMNALAIKFNPDFALLGGDIAYAGHGSGSKPENGKKWLTFLKTWSETMVTEDGRLIPMIPTIGNHDLNGRYGQTPAQALFYYALFAMPGPQGYNVLDFGSYLSIIILDSGHTHPIDGDQTAWLEKTLADRKEIQTKFALYHVPAYPSVRPFDGKINVLIRKNWVPLFEKYHLTAAFEHHEHDYKRSFPILVDTIDPTGVIYLGDGAWGVEHPRLAKTKSQAWYLAKTAPARHIIEVTIEKNRRQYDAIDSEGQTIDSYSQTLH